MEKKFICQACLLPITGKHKTWKGCVLCTKCFQEWDQDIKKNKFIHGK